MKNRRPTGPITPQRGRITGPVSRAICRAYNTSNPVDIARRFATELLFTARIPGPAFSPMEYARSLNVPVKYGRIEADGVFTDTETAQSVFRGIQSDIDFACMTKGPTIILRERPERASRSLQRRETFTLAHELGHYMIRSAIAAVTPLKGLPSDDPEEELLCNAFAEELLMPGAYIGLDLSSGRVGPQQLLSLSNRYEVSVQAMACRVNRFFKGKVACIIWENVRGWHTVEWATPSRLRRALLCDTGKTTVEIAAQSDRSVSGRDDLLLDGERMRWLCESMVLPNGGNKILTVMWRSHPKLNYRRDAPVLPSKTSTPECGPPVPIQQVLPFFE